MRVRVMNVLSGSARCTQRMHNAVTRGTCAFIVIIRAMAIHHISKN